MDDKLLSVAEILQAILDNKPLQMRDMRQHDRWLDVKLSSNFRCCEIDTVRDDYRLKPTKVVHRFRYAKMLVNKQSGGSVYSFVSIKENGWNRAENAYDFIKWASDIIEIED
jgi:hypothetical protein